MAKGYAAENLDYRPDLVIVGNVVTRENPESPRLKELGLPYISLPQAMRLFFLKGKKPLVIAGTHGKTTTSSMAAWLLDAAGMDPGFMIGGILGNYGRNFNLGRGEWFVVEGDEYDTAFFNKVPKFIHYAPFVGVMTSVEYDHADIYPDMDAVISAFEQFVALIPENGLLAAWGDDPFGTAVVVRIQVSGSILRVWRRLRLAGGGYGTGRPAHRFSHCCGKGWNRSGFSARCRANTTVLNTLAVAATLDFAGVRPDRLGEGLETFKGIRRRQEVRGEEDGVMVIDDFAHHPTAVRHTLAGIRAAYPDRRITAVFEPRTNTSRRKVFQGQYAESFGAADRVLIREARDLHKAPEDNRFDTAKLAADLGGQGIDTEMFTDTDVLLDRLIQTAKGPEVVLIMSNGGFDRIHQRLLDGLKKR